MEIIETKTVYKSWGYFGMLFIAIILFILLPFLCFSQVQESDYVITTDGTNISATPRSGSKYPPYTGTDAFTIFQSAVNTLTPHGSPGTGGGKIFFIGHYNLSDEIVISGWESGGIPYSQLILQGEGYSSQLKQTTPGKNALVIKNGASVSLRDFVVTAGSSSKSCILGDCTGSDTEFSLYKSTIDNVYCYGANPSYPSVLLINFALVNVGHMLVENPSGDGLVLQNSSNSVLYGNSNFDFLHLTAAKTAPYAALKIISTNTVPMNLLTFGNITTTSGYYGIYTDYAQHCTFNFVDIEGIPVCIGLGAAASGLNNTSGMTFNSGYLLPKVGGTAISTGAITSANNFNNVFIQVLDATTIPIKDLSTFARPNSFDVTLSSSTAVPNIAISNASNTYLRYRTSSGTFTSNPSIK